MRYLLIWLLLAGCSNLEKLAQEAPPEERGPAQDAKKISEAKRLCTKKYGYLQGSTAFDQCMEENAPGLKSEIKRYLEKEEITSEAKAQCDKLGYEKDTDTYYECVNIAMENLLRATPSGRRQRRTGP